MVSDYIMHIDNKKTEKFLRNYELYFINYIIISYRYEYHVI